MQRTTDAAFIIVHQQLNPSTPGGLTHLLIPAPNSLDHWTTIPNTAEMEQHLLECSRTHFRKAHGTPFTIPPLSDLLGFDGLAPFGEQVTNGEPIPPHLNLDLVTQLLLPTSNPSLPQ